MASRSETFTFSSLPQNLAELRAFPEADSLRQITMRTKPSTGEWFMNQQMLLADIRIPTSADPWA